MITEHISIGKASNVYLHAQAMQTKCICNAYVHILQQWLLDCSLHCFSFTAYYYFSGEFEERDSNLLPLVIRQYWTQLCYETVFINHTYYYSEHHSEWTIELWSVTIIIICRHTLPSFFILSSPPPLCPPAHLGHVPYHVPIWLCSYPCYITLVLCRKDWELQKKKMAWSLESSFRLSNTCH